MVTLINMADGDTDQSEDQSDLFRIRVVEERGSKVKVHYIGYNKRFDEWKERDELVILDNNGSCRSGNASVSHSGNSSTTRTGIASLPTVWQPFSLYIELGNKVKSSLQSSRRESPAVKLDMTFDKLLFEGGLGRLGMEKRVCCGIRRYTIRAYSDIDSLLDKGWHWRGLNEAGDYCYVILDSVEFYLYRKRPLQEFFPSSPSCYSCDRDQGYGLVFTFVRGDGLASDFGRNQEIFT